MRTLGPWKFQYTDESGECFIIAENLGGMVGAALPWPTEIDARDFRRVIANARLIAAAPELLECLKDARRLLTDQDAIDLAHVDSVIAKASPGYTVAPVPSLDGRKET